MKKLKSYELREQYLKFFESKGHKIIPSSSLIPENDPTVLFTTAGMHPLVPYLLGEPHPAGTRLTDVQKCVRTGDIDSVGDNTHCTFFEMLGNWSLGDYFKEESIAWSYEFLTKVLEIPSDIISVTVFEGDNDAPRDEISAKRWEELGIPKERIFYLPKKDNWWGPAGQTGPCGPDTEIFIDTGKDACGTECNPSCSCGKYVEIWNNVFMEYNKTKDGAFEPLAKKNVDTGMGLERTVCMLNGFETVYETDVFAPVIAEIAKLSGKMYGETPEITKAMRIIADHVRTAVFMLGDERGIVPSGVDQGYVLRRVIRRAVRFARALEMDAKNLSALALMYIKTYEEAYPILTRNEDIIINELNAEVEKFGKTLENGLKELEKVLSYQKDGVLNGKTAFRLYDTYGFPIEITTELADERGVAVDMDGYIQAQEKHREKSKAGAEQKFAGGLADGGEKTQNLHTATHIMLRALKTVLADDEIHQRGSNITAERLRFDFNWGAPLTAEQIKAVEEMVNDVISKDMPITVAEMTVKEAIDKGAEGIFTDRYDDIVKVYCVGDFDMQICGGPHAESTGKLGKFKIKKEQSSSSGIRRIKAVLED